MQILDGMSPHAWQGPAAAEDWYADALAEGKHLGVTDYHIGLGEPKHVDITGDYAYVVAPRHLRLQPPGQIGQPNRRGLYGGAPHR
jgi:hypothetical protein